MSIFLNVQVLPLSNYIIVLLTFILPIFVQAYPVAPISEYYIHNVAAVVVFVTGLVYCSLQTYISYAMVHYNVNNRITCHWRFALTLSIICNFIVFIIANKLALSQYGSDKKQAPKLLWTPKQGGYKLHVLSSAAEWLMCFILYFSQMIVLGFSFKNFSTNIFFPSRGIFSRTKDVFSPIIYFQVIPSFVFSRVTP